MTRRVVITGLGVVSPVGNDIDTFWSNIKQGNIGITKIDDRLNMEGLKTKVAAFVNDFDPLDYVSKMELKRYDMFSHYAIAATKQAFDDAGLDVEQMNYTPERIGTIIGSGIGGLHTWEDEFYRLYVEEKPKPKPLFIPMVLSNMAAGNVAIKFKAKGISECPVTACASGNNAIGNGLRAIQYNHADMMIVGGTEASVTRIGLGAFEALTALSKSEDPTRASIPFDADRGGFVMGEGAGILILEELEHAKARGAKIYAEVVGYGASNDAHHMTSPDPEGNGAKRSMQYAMVDANLTPEDIDYINAHGTSTKANDDHETIAIKKALGDTAYKVAISSTKSMTGHMLGAAGGVEGIISALALKDGFIPPTANLEKKDENLDLDYVAKVGREQEITVAMSNAFGFGGHNATIIMKKYVD